MKIIKDKTCLSVTIILCLFILTGCTRDVNNKSMSIIVNGEEVLGNFTGTLVDKLANGEGNFVSSIDNGGWIYIGNFENNEIIGSGTLQNYIYKFTASNNSFDVTYNGECLNGLPNGKGNIQGEINGNSFKYEGEFLQEELSGNGNVVNYPCILSYEDYEISGLYTGEMLDGEFSGQGNFTDTDNDIEFNYNGGWSDGKISGSGHLTCDNYIVHFDDVDRTGIFDGETNNGIAHGEGTFEAINDNNQKYIYTGSWSNGLFNGYGELKYVDSSDDDIIDQIGTFTSGNFTPSPAEFMIYFSGSKNANFNVSEKTKSFIKDNEIYFGENAITNFPSNLIQNVSYEEYAKKSYAYPQLFIETDCKVEGIWEYERQTTISNTITEIYGNIPGDLFADFEIVYFGTLPEVYSDAKLKVTGIPVAYGSMTNVLGGQNPCMFLLASQIEVY